MNDDTEYYEPHIGEKYKRKYSTKIFTIIDEQDAGDGLDKIFICKYESGKIKHLYGYEGFLNREEFIEIRDENNSFN